MLVASCRPGFMTVQSVTCLLPVPVLLAVQFGCVGTAGKLSVLGSFWSSYIYMGGNMTGFQRCVSMHVDCMRMIED